LASKLKVTISKTPYKNNFENFKLFFKKAEFHIKNYEQKFEKKCHTFFWQKSYKQNRGQK